MIAFDNRGMGESDKPAGRYDFGVLAADLGFVLESLGADDVTLVGWSMGCTISLEYLSRGGGRVGRLVLMNGPLKLTQTPEFPWTMTEEQLRGYLDDLGARWPDSEEAFSRGALRDPKSAYADLYYQVALQTPLEMAMRIVDEQVRINHIPVLPTLQIPVLARTAASTPTTRSRSRSSSPPRAPKRQPCRLRGERARAALRGAGPLLRGDPRLHAPELSSDLFHAASIEVAVPAETALRVSLRRPQAGRLDARQLEARGRRRRALPRHLPLRRRRHVRPHLAHAEQLLVDYEVGPAPDRLLRVNSARIIPGPAVGRPEGTCLIALTKWRGPDEGDVAWRRGCSAFDTEIHMIKGRSSSGSEQPFRAYGRIRADIRTEQRKESRCRFGTERTPSSRARQAATTPS